MAAASSRAFITGCGTVSPLGCGVDAFWQGLVAGRSALGPIRGFDTGGLHDDIRAEPASQIEDTLQTLLGIGRVNVDDVVGAHVTRQREAFAAQLVKG